MKNCDVLTGPIIIVIIAIFLTACMSVPSEALTAAMLMPTVKEVPLVLPLKAQRMQRACVLIEITHEFTRKRSRFMLLSKNELPVWQDLPLVDDERIFLVEPEILDSASEMLIASKCWNVDLQANGVIHDADILEIYVNTPKGHGGTRVIEYDDISEIAQDAVKITKEIEALATHTGRLIERPKVGQ